MINWDIIKNIRNVKIERKRVNRLKMIVTLIIALIICLAINYKRMSLQKKQYEYSTKLANVEADIKEEEKRTDDISEYKAYVQTKKYAEEVAREKLGLVYPDEIIFKAEDD